MSSTTIEPEAAPTIRTLENGLTVAMEHLPYVHSVSIGVWMKAGSANELPAQCGISHLLEHMLFKGTDVRTARQIVEEIESRGGQINAFTSREYTCVYAKVLKDHVATAISVLADVVRNSRFLDLDKEKNVVLEEIASSEDVPEEYIHDTFMLKLWPDHPVGRPVAGFLDTVAAIDLSAIEGYHKAWYYPENMIVSVTGHFDEELVFSQIRAAFDDLDTKGESERFPQPQSGRGGHFLERDIAQSHLCFGFPGATSGAEDRFVFDLTSSLLGGGSTSRLFERIREDAGLAYSIYSFNYAYPTAGMFGVYAAVAPENLDQAVDLCFAELRDLRENLVAGDELATNRELLKGSLLMALESTFARMARLAKSLIYHGRVIPVEELVQRIDAVTLSDIQEMAGRVFQPENCSLVVLGPKTCNADGLIRL